MACGFERARGATFWVGEGILVLLLAAPGLTAIALDRGDRAIHAFQTLWGRLSVAWLRLLGVRIVFENLDLLPRDRSTILAANHASLLDILALSAVQPPHTRWVVKRELRVLPVVGWAMRMARFVFVDRQGVAESARRSFEETRRELARSDRVLNLVFFPEGTRTRDGRLRAFKRGAFLIAAECKLPIVPIAITGSFALLPRGWFGRLRSGTMRVRVLPALGAEPVSPWTAETLLEATRARIAAALEGTA
jgi:1-acyl-sn-glycerol-3-phosphate acyltransferase